MTMSKNDMKKVSSELRIAANLKVKEKNYWLNQFSGKLAQTAFPFDYPFLDGQADERTAPGEKGKRGVKPGKEQMNLLIPSDISAELLRLSGGSDSRLHMVLITVLAILLYKYSGETDVVLGTPIYIDPQAPEAEYLNTVLPLKLQVFCERTVKELLLGVREIIVEAVEHYSYPIELLADQLGLEAGGDSFPLFDTVLVLENIQDRNHLRGLDDGLGMVFTLFRSSVGIGGHIDYRSDRFHSDTVRHIAACFIWLATIFPSCIDTRLEEIDILSPVEKNEILHHFCLADARDKDEGMEMCEAVPWLFYRQVLQSKDRTAVMGNRPHVYLTYEELNHEAERLAGELLVHGIEPGTIVGLIVNRSIDILVGILGIWKAGGAYLPIDSSAPDERVGYIISDSRLPILVTTSSFTERIEEILKKVKEIVSGDVHIIDIHANEAKNEKTLSPGLPGREKYCRSSLAYIIYTSGTTGKPKGVMVKQGNLLAYLKAFLAEFTISESDVVVQQASYAFDAFIEEVFPALIRGGRIVIPSRNEVMDINHFAPFLRQHGVTFISCSPLMINQLGFRPDDISGIKLFISGGDVLKREYIHGFPMTAKVYNTYGPTESTVCATYYSCNDKKSRLGGGVPIGRPIRGYRVYILDENLKLLPLGAPGELCIGGDGVGAGYLNQPGLTAEKFIPDPFKPDEIVYRSGDRASWQPDGNLRFWGRVDRQIQLRGFRIEPGEIEYHLFKYEGIEDTAVVPRPDKSGDFFLCAYIVSRTSIQPEDLRNYLSRKLPDYMVPSFFIPLNQLPRTVQGKLDTNALPEPMAGQIIVPYFPGEQLHKLVLGSMNTSRDPFKTSFLHNDKPGHGFRCFIIGETHLPVRCAEILLENGHTILGIISDDQDVRQWAEENGIGSIPVKRNLIIDELKKQPFDFLFSIFNTYIFPLSILELPGHSVINYHDGPLPKYAGLHVPSWAILKGETRYGITWHLVDTGADTGDILIQGEVEIDENDTAFSLNTRCAEMGALVFEKLIQELAEGKESGQKQKLDDRTYFGKYDRPGHGGFISFQDEAIAIDRLVRALDFSGNENPLGVPRLALNNTFLVISAVTILDKMSDQLPGTITNIQEKGVAVATRTEDILLEKVQTVWGKEIPISELVKTYNLCEGYRFQELKEETSQQLDDYISEYCRYETFWVNRLQETTPLGFFKKNTLMAYQDDKQEMETLEFTLPGIENTVWSGKLVDLAVTVFGLMWAELSGLLSFSIGYANSLVMRPELEGLMAMTVPFHVSLESESDREGSIQRLSKELEKVKRNRSYLRDVFIRYPGLQSIAEPCFPVSVISVSHLEQPLATFSQLSYYQFQFLIDESSNRCRWCWDRSLLDKNRVQQWQEYFLCLFQVVNTGENLDRLFVCPVIDEEWLVNIARRVRWQDNREVDIAQLKWILSNHADIREVEILVGHEDVWVFLVSDRRFFEIELKDYLGGRMSLPTTGVRFIRLERLPVIPGGQPDFKLLERLTQEAKINTGFIVPVDPVEKQVRLIWSDILGLEESAISTDANFFEMGGHSLKGVRVSARIHEIFQVKIPLAVLFKFPTVKGLASYIRQSAHETYHSLEKVEEKEYYRLSSAQRRLYILQQMEPGNTGYNMPMAVPLDKEPNDDHLRYCFNRLIERHESLRTAFSMIKGQPVQRVYTSAEIVIKPITRFQDFVQPFDLSQPPLLRVGLGKMESGQYVLMTDMHHIVSDGISHHILIQDFMSLDRGEILPVLKLQYRDYAEWQNREKEMENIRRQGHYWFNVFSREKGDIPVLNMPYDFPRPEVQSFAGQMVVGQLGYVETGLLRNLARDEGVTLYMILLAIFYVFLAKLSGQEDIVVGTPVAGRRHVDLQKIIGIFINTLPLRNFPRGDQSFKKFVADLKVKTLEAFENQDFPFEELVEKIIDTRDLSRNPLFDVMFILQNLDGEAGSGIQKSLDTTEPQTDETFTVGYLNAKFDLTVTVVEQGEGLFFSFEYCTRLFSAETMGRWLAYFKNLLIQSGNMPGGKISSFELMSIEEKQQILFEFNQTAVDFPHDKTLDQFLDEQVSRTPDNIAIEGWEAVSGRYVAITYGELNRRANNLALGLREWGVTQDTLVGIFIEHSVMMLAGLWGILKAGGAYLPLPVDFPAERLWYMLKDSGAQTIITHSSLFLNRFKKYVKPGAMEMGMPGSKIMTDIEPGFTFQVLDMMDSWVFRNHGKDFHSVSTPTHLAYVTYTSGSTGKPKGVMIEHRSVINFIKGITDIVSFTSRDIILSLTNVSFDIFGLEVLLPMTRGSRVIIGNEAARIEPVIANQLIEIRQVTIFQLTPSRLKLQLTDPQGKRSLGLLHYLLVGGESLPGFLLNEIRKFLTGRIINVYGPTETTIWSTARDLTDLGSRLTIGSPLANTEVYIIGRDGGLQALGVYGELCIGGKGLARGYLNRTELTADKFFIPSHPDLKTRERLYGTGDLARWLPDGTIDFMGRQDFQVKIRGYRIELEEIERCLNSLALVKQAVVLARESVGNISGGIGAEKVLCAYYISADSKPVDVSVLRDHISLSLPDYMIPAYFILVPQIPLTQSGKVNRAALPVPTMENMPEGKNRVAPRDNLEYKLVHMWANVLGINSEAIGIDDSFFHFGGHSLKAVALISLVHHEFNVSMTLLKLFKSPTVREMALFIRENGENTVGTFQVPPVEKKEYYRMSSSQKRLYILQNMAPDSTSYNLPEPIPFVENSIIPGLEGILNELVDRHESLRTSFISVKGEPFQRVHEMGEVKMTVEYFEAMVDVAELWNRFVRPFDLGQAPLFRVGWLKGVENERPGIMIVDLHHIISDALSNDILKRDFVALLKEEKLPGLAIQYKDFAEWQNCFLEEAADIISRQEAFWLNMFAGEIPVLSLPMDYERPETQSFLGHTLSFEFSPQDTVILRTLAKESGATVYLVLLSIFYVFLHKLTGQEDIVVGINISGRHDENLENIIGMFVNTIALRHYPLGKKPFKHFLNEVKKQTLKAFENQDYPFDFLVEKIVKHRDSIRNPLFDVMFAFIESDTEFMDTTESRQGVKENIGNETQSFPGYHTAKFDLLFSGRLIGDDLVFNVEYCTSLFKEDTVRQFIRYFKEIVSRVLQDNDIRLDDIGITHRLLTADTRTAPIDFGF